MNENRLKDTGNVHDNNPKYMEIHGSVRLISLPLSTELRVVKKVPLATPTLHQNVQDMYSRAEQRGFRMLPTFFRGSSLFAIVQTIEPIPTIGGSCWTLVGPGMYLWPRFGIRITQSYCIFFCSSTTCFEDQPLQAAEAQKGVHQGKCWACLRSKWHDEQ